MLKKGANHPKYSGFVSVVHTREHKVNQVTLARIGRRYSVFPVLFQGICNLGLLDYIGASCPLNNSVKLPYKKRCISSLIGLERPKTLQPWGERRESKSSMRSLCTIEYGSRNSERQCRRPAVAQCAHCGASVCASCGKECCGQALCGYCYDYHAIHTCLKTFPATDVRHAPIPFRPAPHQDAV